MQNSQSIGDFVSDYKVKFAQRRHGDSGFLQNHMSASIVVGGVHVLEAPSIVTGEGGKRRFDCSYSKIDDGTGKGKRHITPPKRSNSPPRGKRYIPPSKGSGEVDFQSKRHLDFSMKRSDTTDLPKIGWARKGRVADDSGVPAAQKESAEHNLEVSMNRKQRIVDEIDKRNGIMPGRPGDNPYMTSNQEPNFYEKGGLIPGSTVALKPSGKPTMRKNENSSALIKTKSIEATFGKMKARLDHDYDVAQVHSLTIAGSKQGLTVPSWEQRTGCYLVAPEDEAF